MQTLPNQPPGGIAPAFELESYHDETLPHNRRLESFQDLVGHTIAHVFDNCCWQEGYGETIFVTETRCWLVLQAEDGGCDYQAEIKVATDGEYGWERRKRGRAALLSDYILPSDLFRAGLCTAAEMELLEQQQAKKLEIERASQAEVLRAQLAELERGGA